MKIEELLVPNRIWNNDLVDIGKISLFYKLLIGDLTGVMLRGSELSFWFKKNATFMKFIKNLISSIPVGINGDCYDRFIFYESKKWNKA